MFKRIIRSIFEKIGLDIHKSDQSFFTLDKDFKEIYEFCRPYTMTSLERMYALYKATEYIARSDLPGDVVECGVWKGGSAMLVALTLCKLSKIDRKIYLYDTYEGMTEPSEVDIDSKGQPANDTFKKTKKDKGSDWCFSSLDEVKKNLFSTGYPADKLVFVQGKVQETIPNIVPTSVCLLRLDTDWFDSTYHEMKHLYPILEKSGVLILDDYGFWQGARLAVDQYLQESNNNILLNKIDFSGRVGVKC